MTRASPRFRLRHELGSLCLGGLESTKRIQEWHGLKHKCGRISTCSTRSSNQPNSFQFTMCQYFYWETTGYEGTVLPKLLCGTLLNPTSDSRQCLLKHPTCNIQASKQNNGSLSVATIHPVNKILSIHSKQRMTGDCCALVASLGCR